MFFKFISLLLIDFLSLYNTITFFCLIFKDLIVGDAVIQNPFEWNVVSVIHFGLITCTCMLCLCNIIKEDLRH